MSTLWALGLSRGAKMEGMFTLTSALRTAYRRVARSRYAAMLRLYPIQGVHRRLTATRVSATDVVEIVRLLEDAGVRTKLFGGWACDALLGEQTRQHGDLDLIVDRADQETAIEALEENGFERIYVFDAPRLAGTVVELTDHRRRRSAALHFTDLDLNCGFPALLRARLIENAYEPDDLFVAGTVNGHELECPSPAAQLMLHVHDEPTANDRHDVNLILSRFSLHPPPGYG